LGSSNTPCLSSSDMSRRHLRVLSTSSFISLSSLSTPMSCESDLDCAEGLFLECNLQSNLCQSIQQSCPNSCSGHGRCLFVSKYDTNASLPECGMLDEDCVSRCDCEAGYTSSASCSLRDEEVSKAREVRHLILEGLRELMSRENMDEDNVRSWMRTLASIGSDYLSLSVESKRLMTVLTINTLKISRDIGISIEDLSASGMNKVVDMCVSGHSTQSIADDGGDDASLLLSLLEVRSDFVTLDMLEAQNSVSSVTPYLRSTSYFISPSFLNSSLPLVLQIAKSGLDSFAPYSSPQQLIEIIPVDTPLPISMTETLSDLTEKVISLSHINNTNESVSERQLSLPLFVSFNLGQSPCVESEACLMTFFLQHKVNSIMLQDSQQAVSLLASPSLRSDFEVDCISGVVENHSFTCPSGELLTISCNGTFTMRGRQSCPMRSNSVACQTNFRSPQNISCQLIEHNESMSVCLCNLSEVGAIGRPGLVSFSIWSIQRSVLKDFVSTWETVPSLSSGTGSRSWVVAMTLGVLGGLFLVMMTLSIRSDSRDKTVLTRELKIFVGITPSDPIVQSDRSQTKNDFLLIEESLPAIFKSDSLWTKFKEEMKVYHRWLGIVLYYSPQFPRSMRVLALFSSIVIMLFVQSVTYNVSDPDDGSCEVCKNEITCLSLRSTLNSRESRCYWKSNNSPPSSGGVESGTCHFREIGEDMTRMFIVAMIAALVSAPFALSSQYLITNVLSRETLDKEEIENAKVKWNSTRIRNLMSQRQGGAANSPSLNEVCGRSSTDDYNNFLRELSVYYNSLLERNMSDEAKECRGKLI
jgi:hypothetical protein